MNNLPKEVVIALLISITNYKNRIKYLEEQNKISDYKLNRINQQLYMI